jgi:hypothetical protein
MRALIKKEYSYRDLLYRPRYVKGVKAVKPLQRSPIDLKKIKALIHEEK